MSFLVVILPWQEILGKKGVYSEDVFNSFQATDLFWYPLKTSGFLMFPGGNKRDQWHEMS